MTCGTASCLAIPFAHSLPGCMCQGVCVRTQVPQPFDKEEIRERLRKLQGGPTAPLNVHLRQEIDRLNLVIRLTTTTLKNLRLAVAGECCFLTLTV